MQIQLRSNRALWIGAVITMCLVLVVAGASMLFTGNTEEAGMVGADCDVNGDGTVNKDDLRDMRLHIIGETPEGFNAAVADLDGDGAVTAKDVALLQKYLDYVATSTSPSSSSSSSSSDSSSSSSCTSSSSASSSASSSSSSSATSGTTSGKYEMGDVEIDADDLIGEEDAEETTSTTTTTTTTKPTSATNAETSRSFDDTEGWSPVLP